MGCFSWKCQDTGRRIVIDRPMHVVMRDDKNNKYEEECYEGYGEFGGKDYYELLAEMNGVTLADCGGDKERLRQKGIDMAFDGHPHGDNPNVKHPSLTEQGWYCDGKAPESDPDQGFPEEWLNGEEDDEWEEDSWV